MNGLKPQHLKCAYQTEKAPERFLWSFLFWCRGTESNCRHGDFQWKTLLNPRKEKATERIKIKQIYFYQFKDLTPNKQLK